MTFIHLKNLSYAYHDSPVFKPLNFEAKTGEIIHITGENGIGKTTLLKILAGILKPNTGEICTKGIDESLFIGHKNAIWQNLTVKEMISFYAKLYGLDLTDVNKNKIIERIGLNKQKHLKGKRLSFGQQRRLSLARILIKPAQLWLIDEAFTGIDYKTCEIFEDIFHRHLAEEGIIIFSSHEKIKSSKISMRAIEMLRGEE